MKSAGGLEIQDTRSQGALKMAWPYVLYMRLILAGLTTVMIFSALHASLEAQSIDFDKQVAPILVSNCLGCHQGNEAKGGLILTELASLMKGGESGPAIVAGDAEDSLLPVLISYLKNGLSYRICLNLALRLMRSSSTM